MAQHSSAGAGRVRIIVLAALLALGLTGTVLAQTPPAPAATPTVPPARTSTLLAPQPATPTPPVPATSPAATTPTPPMPSAPPAGTPGSTSPVPLPSPTDSPAPAPSPTPGETAAPGPAASPVASPTASPSASATPAPLPSPAPLTDQGVTVRGVFASNINGMIVPAGVLQIVAVVNAPDVERVTMRMSGAPFLTSRKEFDLQPGDNWLQIADFKVDTELEPSIREGIIRKVGGTIPIQDGALVLALDFKDAQGAERTATFQPQVREFLNPERMAKVEYPDLKRITGLPANGAGVDGYYLRGNTDFHHPDDFYVRKLAVEAGRNGGVFPDNPELVADNVFNYINNLFGDADPGDFNNDYNIARLIDEGTIKRGQRNGGYICIGQTYFMTALTRTLGIPSRELNIAVGRPNWLGNDGVWRVTWWQEGAIQTWTNNQWTFYDLYLGFKGLDGYFTANLAYQAWAAYDRRDVPFIAVTGVNTGLRGHNFNLFPGDPPMFEFVGEAVKPGVRVLGMPDESGEPVTFAGGTGDAYIPPAASLPRRGPSTLIDPPAAKPIAGLPIQPETP